MHSIARENPGQQSTLEPVAQCSPGMSTRSISITKLSALVYIVHVVNSVIAINCHKSVGSQHGKEFTYPTDNLHCQGKWM